MTVHHGNDGNFHFDCKFFLYLISLLSFILSYWFRFFRYSFAIVGINMTSLAYNLLCRGSLKSYIYNSIRGPARIYDFHNFYCEYQYLPGVHLNGVSLTLLSLRQSWNSFLSEESNFFGGLSNLLKLVIAFTPQVIFSVSLISFGWWRSQQIWCNLQASSRSSRRGSVLCWTARIFQ